MAIKSSLISTEKLLKNTVRSKYAIG